MCHIKFESNKIYVSDSFIVVVGHIIWNSAISEHCSNANLAQRKSIVHTNYKFAHLFQNHTYFYYTYIIFCVYSSYS